MTYLRVLAAGLVRLQKTHSSGFDGSGGQSDGPGGDSTPGPGRYLRGGTDMQEAIDVRLPTELLFETCDTCGGVGSFEPLVHVMWRENQVGSEPASSTPCPTCRATGQTRTELGEELLEALGGRPD